jgi:hypothetical protein
MNLNEYLIENDKYIGDVVILNSVGTALDKVSGDTYPVYVDGGITFDDRDKVNLMDMDFNDDSWEWYRALSVTDKKIVDEVMDDLSYFDYVLGDK